MASRIRTTTVVERPWVFLSNIAIQRAAVKQIDQLHPVTNAQHGQRPDRKLTEQGALPGDALGVLGVFSSVGLERVERSRQIVAAADHYGVTDGGGSARRRVGGE